MMREGVILVVVMAGTTERSRTRAVGTRHLR